MQALLVFIYIECLFAKITTENGTCGHRLPAWQTGDTVELRAGYDNASGWAGVFFGGGELFAERDIVRAKLGVRWRFGGAVRFVARLDRLELV